MTPLRFEQPLVSTADLFLQFLMLFLYTIASSVLFFGASALLVQAIWGFQLEDLNLNSIETLSNQKRYAYQVIQVGYQIGMFALPPFFVLFLLKKQQVLFAVLQRKEKLINWLWMPILWLVSFPFISYLVEVNFLLHLPAFLESTELWMRDKEAELTKITEMMLNVNSPLDLAINLMVMALVPAIAEEIFFRGMLQRMFQNWLKNPHLAIWLTAFLFSAIHLQFFSFFARFAMGALLGYIFWWTANLRLSMLFHFINNATAVIASYLFHNQIIKINSEAEVGAFWGLSSLLLSIPLIAFFSKQNKSKSFGKVHKRNQVEWIKVFEHYDAIHCSLVFDDLQNQGFTVQQINRKDSSYNLFGMVELYVPKEELDSVQAHLTQKINLL